MKTPTARLPSLLRHAGAWLLAAVACTAPVHAADPKPNIILIISDDHAFDEYGFMGAKHIRTPHLDRMASQSALFTRGYATPVCSPSLATLLTGLHPHQHGITGNDMKSNRTDRTTLSTRLLQNPLILPKALSGAGYLTLQTGKLWNMSYQQAGFTDGMTGPTSRHGGEGLDIGRKGLKPITDFIVKATAEAKPFLVWYAPFLPHDPHTPPERLLEKYRGKGPTPAAEKYYAMIEWLDETCGELDAFLEKRRLTENTLVLYLADNGWNAEEGYKGGRAKMSPYEHGIRTPIFARWPGKIPARRDEETLASIIDIVPTILGAAGVTPPSPLPGISLLDTEALKARKTIFVESYTHDVADIRDPTQSLMAAVVIEGDYKLILPSRARSDKPFATIPEALELYDLKADPLEKRNLAAEKPEVVERLQSRQNAFWKFN